ncbi:MAG TPA: orotidine-5'-phosphate decarboxylase [Candidatus Kapabacteria bacterium]|nr:orotidine-5'-phosphate decarboxylase [Candidatus Kapabacteria bacterium]
MPVTRNSLRIFVEKDTMTFLEKIKAAQEKSHSILCVGLDTDHQKLPDILRQEPNPALAFNKAIIDATSDVACCYKLQLAYYEAYGERSYETVQATLEYIPKHILTICDVKRGDIGATSEKYAYAYQELLPFDAMTINPLMGFDGAEPFLRREDRGVFFLGLTSNPSARDFEYLELTNGKKLYEEITDKVREWNEPKKNAGLVVGATKPQELRALRERAPELPFLIPGVGAQGGTMEEVKEANGKGIAIVNVSRGIIAASKGSDFAEAARKAAMKFI